MPATSPSTRDLIRGLEAIWFALSLGTKAHLVAAGHGLDPVIRALAEKDAEIARLRAAEQRIDEQEETQRAMAESNAANYDRWERAVHDRDQVEAKDAEIAYWTAETEKIEAERDALQARVTALEDEAGLTFARFSETNRRRCESPDGFNHPLTGWSTSDWMTAVLGELGEAANLVKKLNRIRDGVPGNTETEEALTQKLRCELGDVFVYLDLLCQSLGFFIADAARDVFDGKSAQIGCPITLSEPPA